MPATKSATKSATRRTSRTAPASASPRKRAAARAVASPLADVGVPSPYALAELIVGRPIDWKAVDDRPALLESVFQMPYGDLFSPANGSPLYLGQSRGKDGKVHRGRPTLDRKATAEPDLGDVHTLAELVSRIGAKAADVPVRAVSQGSTDLVVRLGETATQRNLRWAGLFDERLIDILFPRLAGYHPDGLTWTDAGRFYNEGTEFLDPVQGAVGDCYVIAAMSSVAWAMPFTIVDRNRATATDNEAFRHQIGFHGDNGAETVEVTDRVLLNSWGGTHFARSNETGEIWPAVYEKAYAKWRLGELTDYPAIPDIAGGDPSIACRQLTGLSDYRNWHNSFSATQILDLVKAHTVNGRTTTPMVSWTHWDNPEQTGDAADVAYRDANVVASHAYSVLGWLQRREFVVDWGDIVVPDLQIPEWKIPIPDPGPFVGGSIPVTPANRVALEARFRYPLRTRLVDYVVLRNPWGFSEATGSSVTSGVHRAHDISWWRDIPLGTDGVFAMEIGAYHRYFAGTGGAH